MLPLPGLSILAPYRFLIIGAAVALAVAGVYVKGRADGKQVIQAEWNAEKIISQKAASDAEARYRQAEQDAAKLAADIQAGGQNAVASVYAWYKAHPNIVYRDGKPYGVPTSCPSASGGSTSETIPSTPDNSGITTDNGYTAPGGSGEVQIIEPDLLPRCADTTVRFLQCREYVLGLEPIFNKE